MAGLVYVAKAPDATPHDPCTPNGWPSGYPVPGPPWPPGWPIPAPVGESITFTGPSSISVGALIPLTARLMESGLDDSQLQYHQMVLTATLNGAPLQLKKLIGDSYANSLAYCVSNYSGGSYGATPSVYANLSSADIGKTVSITICVVSVNPQVCATITFPIAASPKAYSFTLNDTEEYDTVADAWSVKTLPSTPRGNEACFSLNSAAYIVGGFTGALTRSVLTDKYDPPTTVWTAKTSVPGVARNLLSGTVIGTLGYVFGGWNGSGSGGDQTDADEFNDVANSWAAKTALLAGTSALGVSAQGLFGYIFGGQINLSEIQSSAQFSQAGNSWASKTNMLQTRRYLSALALNSNCYVMGGLHSASYLNANDLYTIGSDSFTAKTVIPVSVRRLFQCCVIGTYGYVYGGESSVSGLKDTERYDPVGDSWVTLANMSVNSAGGAGCSV